MRRIPGFKSLCFSATLVASILTTTPRDRANAIVGFDDMLGYYFAELAPASTGAIPLPIHACPALPGRPSFARLHFLNNVLQQGTALVLNRALGASQNPCEQTRTVLNFSTQRLGELGLVTAFQKSAAVYKDQNDLTASQAVLTEYFYENRDALRKLGPAGLLSATALLHQQVLVSGNQPWADETHQTLGKEFDQLVNGGIPLVFVGAADAIQSLAPSTFCDENTEGAPKDPTLTPAEEKAAAVLAGLLADKTIKFAAVGSPDARRQIAEARQNLPREARRAFDAGLEALSSKTLIQVPLPMEKKPSADELKDWGKGFDEDLEEAYAETNFIEKLWDLALAKYRVKAAKAVLAQKMLERIRELR